jgi:uncharacterized repeat protein (TIGR04076 family)
MKKCKITVLQVTYNKAIAEKFSKPGFGPCEVFREGQEFFMDDPWTMPEGFCSGAWVDIAKNVQTVCLGGEFPSAAREGVNISCCVDGVRPVIFLIERIGGS